MWGTRNLEDTEKELGPSGDRHKGRNAVLVAMVYIQEKKGRKLSYR